MVAVVLAVCASALVAVQLFSSRVDSGIDPEYRAMVKQKLASVNMSDGIDEREAIVLAHLYFENRFGACGGARLVGKTNELWQFETAIGIAGAPGPWIYVAAKNGWITCDGEPTVKDLKSLIP